MLDANGKGLTGASFCDDLGKKIGRIDGMEPGNGLGVVRQVQTRSLFPIPAPPRGLERAILCAR